MLTRLSHSLGMEEGVWTKGFQTVVTSEAAVQECEPTVFTLLGNPRHHRVQETAQRGGPVRTRNLLGCTGEQRSLRLCRPHGHTAS